MLARTWCYPRFCKDPTTSINCTIATAGWNTPIFAMDWSRTPMLHMFRHGAVSFWTWRRCERTLANRWNTLSAQLQSNERTYVSKPFSIQADGARLVFRGWGDSNSFKQSGCCCWRWFGRSKLDRIFWRLGRRGGWSARLACSRIRFPGKERLGTGLGLSMQWSWLLKSVPLIALSDDRRRSRLVPPDRRPLLWFSPTGERRHGNVVFLILLASGWRFMDRMNWWTELLPWLLFFSGFLSSNVMHFISSVSRSSTSPSQKGDGPSLKHAGRAELSLIESLER